MSLADYVRILGRGPGRSRSFTQGEAREAMRLMLGTDAAAEAVGAVLMLMRMKGEVAEEIAGFAQAAQDSVRMECTADLDWPSYAAGRTRGVPWFLLSARLVVAAGYKVLLHGWNGQDRAIRDGLVSCGIGMTGPDGVQALLDRDGIAYVPLEDMAPDLFRLLSLRNVLGLRSCVNTVCRMLNPGRARASVQGVFHPSYRQLQTDAAALIGLDQMTVIKGGGGEFERHAAKEIAVFGRRDGVFWDETRPALYPETRRLADTSDGSKVLTALWSGALEDAFAEAVVIGTAELALATLGHDDAAVLARALWQARDRKAAA